MMLVWLRWLRESCRERSIGSIIGENNEFVDVLMILRLVEMSVKVIRIVKDRVYIED